MIPVLLGISVFGLSTAQMDLPTEFALQVQRNKIAGFGGHNKGSFELEQFRGEFTRGESRLGVFDPLFVSNKGKSSFTLRDKSSNEILSAKEKFLAKDLRRGEAMILDHHLLIESVHRYQGSKLQSPAPVGYLLRQGDQMVAAVELTDVNPTLLILPDTTDDLRHSIVATALALAVLRDPANSALED